jgi:hypothetical protein
MNEFYDIMTLHHFWASEVAAPFFQKVAERMIVYESADKGKIMV